ncbi:DUF1554 domain-containing protein [Leptospira congkakensis]|uniref:DUF1554 domain-containing protein n=1 Tax=Leptospira congkakensis TaxID=2484932 RepID=A0A4Z1A4E6_9LEPT|nr:DUF1554 domain-containing protein [Leptospira congkakensis]TGL87160.1 DUF1554 domain-containing protein [Leptospira congkakensis]TGL96728.1 DUF1554 domain-containing protein [Leptospira congkakensis]TGL97577.1 DUF1554 domain-containing protein [Leptospira congkakensis]
MNENAYVNVQSLTGNITILFLSLGLFTNCDPSQMDNSCDLSSESFSKTMVVKSILGDKSSHCLSNANTNHTNFSVGGKISGLTGAGLILILNQDTSLNVPPGSTEFSFPNRISIGSPYEVNFSNQPQGNFCELVNPNGKIFNKDITEIEINCFAACTNCKIFVTQNSYPANVGKASNFDSFCQSDPNYPGTGKFKAMVVDGESRRASFTPNSGEKKIDWVFKANQAYIQDNGSNIESSNNNGLFTTGISIPITNITSDHWTGLNTDWTTNTNATCKKWITNSGSETGISGDAYTNDVVTLTAGRGPQPCSTIHELVCVEQ